MDHLADAFVCKNVARHYDVAMMLCHSSLHVMSSGVRKKIFQCLSNVFGAKYERISITRFSLH